MNDQTQPIPAVPNPGTDPQAPVTDAGAPQQNKPKRWKGRLPLVATAAAGLAIGAIVASAVFAATGPDESRAVSTAASSSALGQRSDGGTATDGPAAPVVPESTDGSTAPTPPAPADGVSPPTPGDGATPPALPTGGPGKGSGPAGGPAGPAGPAGAQCTPPAPDDGATPPAPPAAR